MRALIIEDEPRAAQRLARMIAKVRPDMKIEGPAASLASARQWFANHAPPDLVFLDIQLEDADGFELLEAIDVTAPVIFCTAYAEHALRAFKVNSIDYLLKPVTQSALQHALGKYEKFAGLTVKPETWRNLDASAPPTVYRQRFLVERRRTLSAVPVASVVAVRSWMKISQLVTEGGEELAFEESLSGVMESLDPAEFFQISRQAGVRLSAVEAYNRADRRCTLRAGGEALSFIVSRARQSAFREALTKTEYSANAATAPAASGD